MDCLQTFIKVVNYQHMMPTRYTLDIDLKNMASNEIMDSHSKRLEARKVCLQPCCYFRLTCPLWPSGLSIGDCQCRRSEVNFPVEDVGGLPTRMHLWSTLPVPAPVHCMCKRSSSRQMQMQTPLLSLSVLDCWRPME